MVLFESARVVLYFCRLKTAQIIELMPIADVEHCSPGEDLVIHPESVRVHVVCVQDSVFHRCSALKACVLGTVSITMKVHYYESTLL